MELNTNNVMHTTKSIIKHKIFTRKVIYSNIAVNNLGDGQNRLPIVKGLNPGVISKALILELAVIRSDV